MICPHCQAENQSDGADCARCGKPVSSLDNLRTLAGETLSLGNLQPEQNQAIGVATPPVQSPAASGSGAPAPFSVTLEPGAEFGARYRILGSLGKGGMGLVYKAHDVDLDRTVALKLVRPNLTADPEAIERFKRELLLASRISHKNVLRIHDLGDAGGVKFISMAYVDGEDLGHLLRRRGRLPVERVVQLARQLCAALDAAHTEGIVHRDLKPQNVLIDQDGNAFVSDFGLAKSLETGLAEMTHAGQFLGTPRYMSPEQAQGRPADPRSDIYALGLILYEALTGDIPFKSDSIPHMLLQRISQKAKSPVALNPDVPDYLARIVLRCLEADPDRRYQSAREVLRDLDAAQSSTAHFRPSRSGRWTLAAPKNHRRLYGVIAAGVIAIAVAALLFTRRPGQAPRVVASASVPSLSQGKYLAILPFHVLGDRKRLGYLADGLDGALPAKLFNMAGLHIIPPAAAEGSTGTGPVTKVASELGANLVVHGSVRSSGANIDVIVHLEDVAEGRLLWAHDFTGVPGDLLTIEDQISKNIAQVLNLNPGSGELARAAVRPTENVAAYALYLKGEDALRGLPDAATVQKAISFYQSALQQDPGFALAYAGVADASLQMYRESKDRIWIEQALAAAQQARELNSTLPQVYMALGSVYSATGRNAEAVEMLNRATRLAPNSDEAYRLMGKAYEQAGQEAKAIDVFKKAARLDPYYWVNAKELGDAYDVAGDYGRALAQFERVTQLDPENAAGYEDMGNVYMQEGEFSQSVPALEKALQRRPNFRHYSNLGTAYFFVKRYDDAARMFEKAVALSPKQEAVVGNLGEAYLFGRRQQAAQQAFNKAIALAYQQLQVNPSDAETMGDLSIYYACERRPAEALQFARRARGIDPGNAQYVYDEAVIQAFAGDSSKAVGALHDALKMGFPPLQAESDPQLASLQSRPEFKLLMSKFRGKQR